MVIQSSQYTHIVDCMPDATPIQTQPLVRMWCSIEGPPTLTTRKP